MHQAAPLLEPQRKTENTTSYYPISLRVMKDDKGVLLSRVEDIYVLHHLRQE